MENGSSGVEEIAWEYAGRVKFHNVNTNDYQQVAISNSIEQKPSIILFKNGKKIQSIFYKSFILEKILVIY